MSSAYYGPSSVIALCSSFLGLDIIAVALRFRARRRQNGDIRMDDWLLIPALLFNIGTCVSLIVGVKLHTIGYHSPPLPPGGLEAKIHQTTRQKIIATKVEWLNLWMQPWILGPVKMSIVLFYRRIFDTPKRGNWLTYTLNGVLLVLVLWTLAFFFAQLFMCGTHLDYLWGPYIDVVTKCADGHAVLIDYAQAISDFCLDVIVLLIPIPPILSLRIPLKKRLLVALVFIVGASAIVGSLIRMIINIDLVHGFTHSLASQDGLLATTQSLFWGEFECGLAIITACLPTIHYLIPKGKQFGVGVFTRIRQALSFQSLRSSIPSAATKPSGRDEEQATNDSAMKVPTYDLDLTWTGPKWGPAEKTSEKMTFQTHEEACVDDSA